jgi:RND family efflux transporter MFP subunit
MKKIIVVVIASSLLFACKQEKQKSLSTLKAERAALDEQIKAIEAKETSNKVRKSTDVSIMSITPTAFVANIDIQAQVTGEQNVLASPQAPGTVTKIFVKPGQHVSSGQVLATLDASALEQQIQAVEATLSFARSAYDRLQKLYAQNIGSEIKLLETKAQYESASKQKNALQAQLNMYKIKSPITGTIDAVTLKVGDVAQPGGGPAQTGIRVVSFDKLKVEANLGENYLGKVKTGNAVLLVLPDINDSIATKLSYVSQAVDNASRTFHVEVSMPQNKLLHPNMSCKMQITNYKNPSAIVIPISIVQKTAEGDLIYIEENKKAKAVFLKLGNLYNGKVEVLSGLKAGDRVIVEGFAELDNGAPVTIK